MPGSAVLSRVFVAILGIFCVSVLSQASELSADLLLELSIEELSEVKITSIATGTKKLISDAPSIASVLTAEEMQRMGATTLEEALEAIPGLHVSLSGSAMAPRYLIRGIATTFNPQVLVLINGIPITSIVRGDRNGRLAILPLKMVSRVEVIRGPGSARFGADAFAGVINVVTKNSGDLIAENQSAELGGHLGSFNTSEAWFLKAGQRDDLKWTVLLDARKTSGHRREIREDAQTGLDQALSTRASLAPGPMNLQENGLTAGFEVEKNKWRLRGISYQKYGVGLGSGATNALDPTGKTDRTRNILDLTYHEAELAPSWDLVSQFSFQHGTQEKSSYLILFPPGANLGRGVFPEGVIGSPEYFERTSRFDNSLTYAGFEKHRLQMGLGLTWSELYKVQDSNNFNPNFSPRPDITDISDTADINLPEKGRHSSYVFVQDEWNFMDRWELIAGVREDRYSDFGQTINPRMALVWETTDRLTTKFLYGRAFRAPAFAELYTINNPVALGNPDVKPETIDVYEIGWTLKESANLETSFNLFRYEMKDLITFVRNSNGSSTAQNFSKQHGQGFELETTWKPTAQFFLSANYSFTDAKDGATDRPPGQYPRDKAYLRTHWSFQPQWTLGTQALWVGPRDREPQDTRNALKGYATVDLTLRRVKIHDKYAVTFAVKNLFDDDAREPSPGPGASGGRPPVPDDYPQPGRSAFVEISSTF